MCIVVDEIDSNGLAIDYRQSTAQFVADTPAISRLEQRFNERQVKILFSMSGPLLGFAHSHRVIGRRIGPPGAFRSYSPPKCDWTRNTPVYRAPPCLDLNLSKPYAKILMGSTSQMPALSVNVRSLPRAACPRLSGERCRRPRPPEFSYDTDLELVSPDGRRSPCPAMCRTCPFR